MEKENFTYSMLELSKLLPIGLGRTKLMALLREQGYLMPCNLPYQNWIDKGYFTTKLVYRNGGKYIAPYVTEDGLYFLRNNLVKIKGE